MGGRREKQGRLQEGEAEGGGASGEKLPGREVDTMRPPTHSLFAMPPCFDVLFSQTMNQNKPSLSCISRFCFGKENSDQYTA